MGLSNTVRDFMAFSTLFSHKLLGYADSIKFSNRGEASVTLTAAVGAASRQASQDLGADVEDTGRTFEIAKQTNFPPSDGIAIDAQIFFPAAETNYYWRVTAWRAAGEGNDGIGAVYELDCVREQARRVGV